MNFKDLKNLIKYYKSKPITDDVGIDIKTIKYLEQLRDIYTIIDFDNVSIDDKIFEIEGNVSKLNVKDIESKEIIKAIQSKLGLLLINYITNELKINEENLDN